MTPTSSRELGRRALWLCVCLVAGLGVGTGGQWLTGDAAWFLAVPVCIAVGWFWLADPQQCLPQTAPRRKRQASQEERVADD